MSSVDQTIIFLCGGHCFHTMDWFRSAQKLNPHNPPIIATDLIKPESFEKLIKPTDRLAKLFIIDRLLFKKKSRNGNIWRNFVKMSLLPLQVIKFRKYLNQHKNTVVHANCSYYIAIARFSGCKYVASLQGSEVLVRPYRSWIYKFFLRVVLSRASCITVDSVVMQESLEELYGFKALLVQYGIDVNEIMNSKIGRTPQRKILSLRGFSPNYQIEKLLDARNSTLPSQPLHFSYPFADIDYKNKLRQYLIQTDQDLGKLSKAHFYELLKTVNLVISIPTSDSSPRSVYEAIFCGCFVAVTSSGWISLLPSCMAKRVIVVNLNSKTWLIEAIRYAEENTNNSYIPSEEALEMFDIKTATRKFYQEIYPSLRTTSNA